MPHPHPRRQQLRAQQRQPAGVLQDIHAGHLRARTNGIQQFGEMRRERDDALRRPAEFKNLPGIIANMNRRCLHRRSEQQAKTNEAVTDHRWARLPP